MLILLAFAAVIRLAILLLFPSVFAFEQTGTIHGSSSYDVYAINLLETGVYGLEQNLADARIPPLYGYVLAGVYGILGRSSLAVGVFHTLLDLVSIALIADTCRRLFKRHGDVIGWFTGVFYALYPYLIFQNLTLIDTPLFMTLFYLFIWLIVLLRQAEQLNGRTIGIAIAAGIVLGITALDRPVIAILAILLPLWFMLRRSFIQSILRLGIVAIFSVIALAPWTLRNYEVYGEFVSISVTGGSNFYQGNNANVIPFLRAGYDVQWTAPESVQEEPNTPAGDSELMSLGMEYLRENPSQIPELLWVKFLAHWSIDIFPRLNPTASEVPLPDYRGETQVIESPDGSIELTGVPPNDPTLMYDRDEFSWGRVIHRLYFGGLLILAVIGVVLTWRQWREMSLLWIIQISMTFAYVALFHPSTRYRVPSDPALFIFSAVTLVQLAALVWRKVLHRDIPKLKNLQQQGKKSVM